ncbi:unnamed protein product [Ectocarpus sp. CCAP 1310/34]|nr:unnamed protein product [Ectocarpus sp. CCAP 1310/34]
MLESTVLHQSRTGPRGQPNDVVGINWKAPTRSHPSPSLVVTCAHQVVVYKPGEERRTHQWSFKPSAATVLSHPAVFLPSRSRYVGVQQGSTLVSWRESEQDVKRPLSSQAAGPIQAVHACPRLGDYFVAVLASGGVVLYQGGLQRAAHFDAAGCGGGDDSGGSAGDARAKVVWSGVRGDRVLVLENTDAAADRVTTFSLSVGGVGSSSVRRDDASAAAADVPASVNLVSSHILTKPSGGGGSQDGERAAATSAAFLGRDSGGSGEGRSVISVAWRTSSGPVWTKAVIGAGGVTEEFARRAGGAVVAGSRRATEYNDNGVVSVSSSNGHGTPKAKSKKPAENQSSVGEGSGAAWASVPAIAAADGGRLLIHSGSGGYSSPRLAVWDSSYGVLLEDGVSPEFSSDSGRGGSASRLSGRAVGLKVSGDGAHLAIAAAGKVLVCPLPAQAAGTLASLLRRKRPSPSAIGESTIISAGRGSSFPSIDLSRSIPASTLLEKTGAVEAGKWEAAVVVPFREAEAGVIRSLGEAARRKDIEAFEQVLREHQGGSCSSDGRGEDGSKKRQRGDGRGFSAGVVAAAVELCLANPDAKLWGGLGVLVRSGGVSARHHRGLVAEIVEHASPELLEEVMLHVPDLPEVDAVRILRHFLSQAATLAEASGDPAAAEVAAAVVPVVPNEESGGAPPTKRARGGNGGGTASAGGSPDVANGGVGVVVSVLSPSEKRGVKVKGGGGGDVVKAGKKKMGGMKVEATAAAAEDGNGTVIHENASGDGKSITTNSGHVSNGHAAAHDDGGTSSDSGGGSDAGGTQMVVVAGGGEKGTGAAAAKGQKGTSKKGVGPRAAAAAAASQAERGVRVALTMPHNEAFLRSALAELSHREVVVVLKILTRLLAEGKTLETGAKPRGQNAALVARGLPPAHTESVLAWACAVLDSHFTRLAIGGAADGDLVGTLKALKRAARVEAGCCELLSQVRSLVDEVGRRHAAAEAASRRRPSSSSPELFSLRVVTF